MISIGIDLGTSSSAIAYFDGKEAKVFPNTFGETTVPSKVIWNKDGRFFVGREALNHPDRYEFENFTLGSIKRSMDQTRGFVLSGRRHYPQVVSALVLAELRRQAEVFLKTKIEEAVICIPCNFGVVQRYATIEAAEMAGFKVLRILNEATAAAVAFSYLSGAGCDNELIFDLGAGTLDLSLIEYGQGLVQVKAIEGDEYLGGDDFDEIIVKWIVEETKKNQGFDPIEDQQFGRQHVARLRLKEAAEKAKIELSSQSKARIYLPYIRNILGKVQHIDLEITDSIFQSLCEPLTDRIIASVERFVKDFQPSTITVDRTRKKMVDSRNVIDKLLLKKSRMKEVDEKYSQLVKKFDKKRLIFTGCASKMKHVNDRIKWKYSNNFDFISKEKELVAMGAAIQAGIIKGICKDIIVLDCTSKSIGIELLGGVYERIIPKHQPIPTKHTKTFTTTKDDQKGIHIAVYEGEKPMAGNNIKIIDLEFELWRLGKAGTVEIEVTFDVDVGNVLRVEAKDSTSGKKLESTKSVSPYTNLDPRLKNKIKQLIENWLVKKRND